MSSEEIAFDGEAEVPGADVFLADGNVERLAKPDLEKPLFHQQGASQDASAGQLLASYYEQTRTTPQDLVRRDLLERAAREGVVSDTVQVEVKFGSSDILFRRGAELHALDRVVFDIQLTVRPHRSS